MKILRNFMICLIIFFMLLLSGCGGDIESGEQAFQRCISCHSMKPQLNYTGPSLASILNRKAGTAEGFNYSRAVKTSGIVWTVENLDTWLTNPQAFIPGTKMEFEGIPDPEVRAELIAILKLKTVLPIESEGLP
ncbi:c-type cytochrome [Pseudomonadota bacterium]